ncbi:MAG: hypothetical protein HQL46_07365 [Gammaproteobacteria bacterium]|nr:hypothetical protein [Gammaproteobacteria bacterium]
MSAKNILNKIYKLDNILSQIRLLENSHQDPQEHYSELINLINEKYNLSYKKKAEIFNIVRFSNEQRIRNKLIADCFFADIVPTQNDKLMPLNQLKQKVSNKKSELEKLIN